MQGAKKDHLSFVKMVFFCVHGPGVLDLWDFHLLHILDIILEINSFLIVYNVCYHLPFQIKRT